MEEKIKSKLKKLEEFNEKIPSALMPKTSAELINFLARSINAKNILEIGTRMYVKWWG